jgi:hypothetical protein
MHTMRYKKNKRLSFFVKDISGFTVFVWRFI